MNKPNIAYGLAGRADEKQAARERDDARIAAGLVTEAEVARRNDLFADFDVKSFRIAAIGRRPIKHVR